MFDSRQFVNDEEYRKQVTTKEGEKIKRKFIRKEMLIMCLRCYACVVSQMFLIGVDSSLDRPFIVQFASNQPETFLQAAKLVEPYCDGKHIHMKEI